MLYRLELSNFYCFREPQVVDLRIKGGVPEEKGRFAPIFPGSDERVPRVVAFFGSNASGKSTVLKALAFITWFVRDSFQLHPDVGLACACFYNEECLKKPIRIAIEFGGPLDPLKPEEDQISGTWRYELSVTNSGGRFVVAEENLRQRARGKGKWTRLFERTGDSIIVGKSLGLTGYNLVIDKVRDNASLIATLAQFDHKLSLHLQRVARSVLTNILLERTEARDEDAIRYYADNADAMASLNREIQRIDLGIRSMEIVQGVNGPVARFLHEGLKFPMPWSLESHGTRSFIRNFPLIQGALNEGGIAIADEIDISIHPLVLPEIIRWFYDASRNPRGAQLWITCHAASLLEDLTKEEVFFCEKDSSGAASVYALQDIERVRRSDNRYRKYLSGIYGAVPKIG